MIKVGGGTLSAVKVYCEEAPAIFTFTDAKGNYKIEVPEEVKHLVFTYTGMQDKTIMLKEFNRINAVLIPSQYKRFRYGVGISSGISSFKLEPDDNYTTRFDTTISMRLISVSANLFYRFHKNFDLQTIIEDGLNTANIDTDSTYTNSSGIMETVYYTDKIYLNRFTFSLILNYYLPFGKTKNHSFFAGIGPQYQHLSFLKTNTAGARFQTGININEYGFTTKLFFAIDVSKGTFEKNNQYVPGLAYNYNGARFGIVFILK